MKKAQKTLLVLMTCCLLNALYPQKTSATDFGMFYHIWHCRATAPYARYDMNKAAYGFESWGPIPRFHWTGEPASGYYCLANNEDLLRQHAQQLTDIGIDFVYVDITNWDNTATSLGVQPQILSTFPKLLQVWSSIPNAPKIVPWVPITTSGNMVDWIISQMDQHPSMYYNYQSKPLLLTPNNPWFLPDESKLSTLRNRFTIKKMWGPYSNNTTPPNGIWSYIQRCQSSFLGSGGTAACNQRAIYDINGNLELIPVATSYQETYMSKKTTSTPKFYGRTFRRQFDKVLQNRDVPIVLINGWNEWIAQRFCFDSTNNASATNCNTSNDTYPDGNRLFVDNYHQDYSREIEPRKDAMKDYYARLAKACIKLYESNQSCPNDNLCCKDYWGWDFGTPFNPTNDGWVATNHLSNNQTIHGIWLADITGPDPFLVQQKNLNYPASSKDEIRISMKVSGGGALIAELFWTTSTSAIFDENHHHAFLVQADNQWHEYTIKAKDLTNWSGTIQKLRFDPINHHSGAKLEIDYIHLYLGDDTITPPPPITPIPPSNTPHPPSPTPNPADIHPNTPDGDLDFHDYLTWAKLIMEKTVTIFNLNNTIAQFGEIN